MKSKLNISILSVLLGSVALLLPGCASIVNGTNQIETFRSVPRGAHVKIDGEYYGNTPVTAILRRKRDHTIDINLPGYQPARFVMEQHVSGWYFGNILIGGIIGLVVDYADGAIYTLEPSNMHHFTNDSIRTSNPNTITIVMAKRIPAHLKLKKVGQLKKRA